MSSIEDVSVKLRDSEILERLIRNTVGTAFFDEVLFDRYKTGCCIAVICWNWFVAMDPVPPQPAAVMCST